MLPPQAVIFDLGGTLIDWPDWDEDICRRWGLSYDHLTSRIQHNSWPAREAYIQAMRQAEMAHWKRVREQYTSDPPEKLLQEGFRLLGYSVSEEELLTAIDGYAQAVIGWATVFPDARPTLQVLREKGYRLGLLSNTWWAASWHNADLATHGLESLLDTVAYTSDLAHSKPHPDVFLYVARQLGIAPEACVMVGDRKIDDVGGALHVGMRGVWKKTPYPWPEPEEITPTAIITNLDELPALLQSWGGK